MSSKMVWILPMIMLPYFNCGPMDGALFGERIQGSGKVIRENRDVRGFSVVNFSGSGDLSIRQGNEESLSIEADDNILPYIRSDVEGGKLTLGFRRGVSIRTSSPLRYTLTVKELEALDLSGAGKTHTGPMRTQDFRVHLSGSGEIRMDDLDAATLRADISGSGNMEIPGRVDHQEIRISGSGRYYARDLDSQSADVTVSGSGDCTLQVAKSLSAHISGSGSVGYYGNPTLSQRVSGSGRVRRLDDRE